MSSQFFLVLTFALLANAQHSSRITITRNGFDNVVAAIHPDVVENSKILQELKTMFATGSEYLHIATRERSFFRNVSILVPSTWEDKPEYDSATWETFENADLRVDKSNPIWGHNPYTKQPGGCGERGHYIHLTPEFVTDTMLIEKYNRTYTWGDIGRVLVHEFAHLRWGVFDEYGFENDPDHPLFYLDSRGATRATSCILYPRFRGRTLHKTTKGRCGRDPNTRLPEKDCRFYPDLTTRNRAKGSVMFMQFVHSVDTFCENHHPDTYRRHEKLAPNKQNKMCNQQGTWDVISKNIDFFNDSLPNPNVDTTPNIRVVYQRRNPKKVVLVLDTSGSMLKNKRFLKLNQAAAQFIHDSIPVGSQVGIIQFSSRATNMTPSLISITEESDKDFLLDSLPKMKDVGGGTGIGGALMKALWLMDSTSMDVSGTTIILVTDGRENRRPFVLDTLPYLTGAGVVVNTVAYTNEAAGDVLETLAEKTGGLFFYCAEDEQVVRLNNAFDKAVTRLSDDREVRQDLASYSTNLTIGTIHRRAVTIDETIGRNTEFTFAYQNGSEIEVVLKSPEGVFIGKEDGAYNEDKAFSIVRISIPMANPGKWSYTIKVISPTSALVQISVKSKARSTGSGNEPIKVSTWMSSIAVSFPAVTVVLAEVTQGYKPVIGATVLANIERPGADVHSMPLLDNGAGADVQANDGVYSAYFTAFTGNGKYSVQAVVSNENGKAELKSGGGGGGAAITRSPDIPVVGDLKTSPAPPFQRVGTAGAFSVINYIPGMPDQFPPSRILDVKLASYSYDDHTVTLSWTAPGEDFDQGTVAAYEIRVSKNDTEMLDNFNNSQRVSDSEIVETIVILPSGGKQTVTIRVLETGQEVMYFFRIRAVDKNGLYSEPSNIVGANMAAKPGLSPWAIAAIVLSAAAVLIAAFAITFICKMKARSNARVMAKRFSMVSTGVPAVYS